MRLRPAAFAGLWAPSNAYACAACVAAADRNRTFFIMTIVLSLLPLAMIGGGVLWIARRSRGRLAAEFEEREAPAVAADRAPTFSVAGPPGETAPPHSVSPTA